MPASSIRARLADGELCLGGWIQLAHPGVAHVLASSGYDWVALDLEHGAIGDAECAAVISTIRAAGCEAWVRLPGNAYADNKRYLDMGATGLICPLVTRADDARLLVRSAKYPPQGERGVGFCAANGYGFAFDPNLEAINDTITCAVMIEHADALAGLDGILSVDGIDAAFIGPYDLSASLGIPAQFEHPYYQEAVERIREVCREHGIVPGIHVVDADPHALRSRVDEGYRLVVYSLDATLLGSAARAGIRAVRAIPGDAS